MFSHRDASQPNLPTSNGRAVRSAVTAGLVLTSALLTVAATANERRASENPGVPTATASLIESLRGTGTINFDNDTPFRRDGTDGGTVGNRFAITPPMGPTHSIATVSFAVAGNFSTSVVMSVWDVNPASVQNIARSVVGGIPQAPSAAQRFQHVLAAPVVGHVGSFIAGLRNTDYDPCAGNESLASTCDGVALTQGTAGVANFRAARVNFSDPSFVPTITNVASPGADMGDFNAIFRVAGDNLPVELMHFGID